MQYPGTQYSIQVHLLPGTQWYIHNFHFQVCTTLHPGSAILHVVCTHVRGRVSVRELSVNVLILFFTPSCMATNNVRRDVHRDGKNILDLGSPPPPLTAAAACQLIVVFLVFF
jgi:hypothetical protein